MSAAIAPAPSYSTVEVARRMGVSIQTVQRWVDAGHLRAWVTVGGHRRIEAAGAEQMFERMVDGKAVRVKPAEQTRQRTVAELEAQNARLLAALQDLVRAVGPNLHGAVDHPMENARAAIASALGQESAA